MNLTTDVLMFMETGLIDSMYLEYSVETDAMVASEAFIDELDLQEQIKETEEDV